MPTHRTGLSALTFALYAACAQASDLEKAVDYRRAS